MELYLLLRNIYNIFLLREIKEILQLSSSDKLIQLMKSLSLQASNLISYADLSAVTGLTYPELKKHMQILEETYITRRITASFSNKRTELVKTPKIYFIDTGFRNACIDNYSKERADIGALHENFILSELLKKDKQQNIGAPNQEQKSIFSPLITHRLK